MKSILNVIYEDENILAVDKSAGLVVTPEDTSRSKTLSDILTEVYHISLDRGGVVHRLDKDTSGVLLVAKTLQALKSLQVQFKKRQIKKQYLALVHGFVEKVEKVAAQIARNPANKLKYTVYLEGRESETLFEPVKRLEMNPDTIDKIFNNLPKPSVRNLHKAHYGRFTLLKCYPLTGRTHQIRVHLKYINHPVVSDLKYGGRKNSKLDLYWCPRQFLHASQIEFIHPKTKKQMKIHSPLPEDLENALKLLAPA